MRANEMEWGQHFARVRAIVGDSLREKRVAVFGVALLAPIVRMLAASGLRRWLWAEESTALRDALARQHGRALDAEILLLDAREAHKGAPFDLVVGAGGATNFARMHETARAANCPALWIEPPACGSACRAGVWMAGETGENEVSWGAKGAPGVDYWGWATSAPLCAGLARGLLLRGTGAGRADLEQLWWEGARLFAYGGSDALDVSIGPRDLAHKADDPFFQTPPRRSCCLLVAGLGSLGSVTAMHLRDHFERMVLVDPDVVDVYNPVRQAYPVSAVGRAKAYALAEQTGGTGLVEALVDEHRVEQIVETYGVTAALVATGTHADFSIARALRRRVVVHVVGRCYPRARYWEAILVDGRNGPAFDEMRGHVAVGPAAPLTPEERALYADPNALEGEPATLVESGWAAAWMARLIAQLAAPAGLRERWMLELLHSGRTCLIGGVGVTESETGDGSAYEITLPGQIRAWQRVQLT